MSRSLFDKLWDAHVVRDDGDGWALLHIDRHLLHDLSGAPALAELGKRELPVRRPELSFATPDHAVSSAPGRSPTSSPLGGMLWTMLRERASHNAIQLFDFESGDQGIVHVIGPELGIVLPGMTVVCGDSHTCTNGGLGALAFGIGSSEIVHVLATQTLRQCKPKSMRIRFDGILPFGVSVKDVMLYTIGLLGAAAATGYAVEFAGPAIEAMGIEQRLTICNLSIEMGAKYGFVAPDELTFAYLAGRRYAPKGDMLDRALVQWRRLRSEPGAIFDREETIDISDVAPFVTWGTSMGQTIPIDGFVPDPAVLETRPRATAQAALDYMALEAGAAIAGTAIDWVFIGSCANSRLSDLHEAALVARGRRVASDVHAWVVPGSQAVKREAEAAGLDRIFIDAGFEWREPGCSLCVAANGERIPAGARVVSTSNRNFVGRQGPGSRTHLASPAMAAAAAVTGVITDVRGLIENA